MHSLHRSWLDENIQRILRFLHSTQLCVPFRMFLRDTVGTVGNGTDVILRDFAAASHQIFIRGRFVDDRGCRQDLGIVGVSVALPDKAETLGLRTIFWSGSRRTHQ
jgi:hypothetical protein